MERHEILSDTYVNRFVTPFRTGTLWLFLVFHFPFFIFRFHLYPVADWNLPPSAGRSKVTVSYKSADRGSVSHLRTLLADFSQNGGLKNETLRTNKRPVLRAKTQQPRNKTKSEVTAVKQQQNQRVMVKLITPTTRDVTLRNLSQQLSSKSV